MHIPNGATLHITVTCTVIGRTERGALHVRTADGEEFWLGRSISRKADVTILPNQLTVGSRAKTALWGYPGTILAENEGRVWSLYDNGTYATRDRDDLQPLLPEEERAP